MDAEDGGDNTTQACPRCQQTDFNYEDLDEGTKLVCRDCGYVLDEVFLVHQSGFDDEGVLQAGVRVNEADDGRLAGTALISGGAGARGVGMSSSSKSVVLAQNKEHLDSALSYLQLPASIATAARQLLQQVVNAFRQSEQRMLMSPATVAAVIYITARQEGRALSLGAAAAALNVPGPHVFREFRRVAGVLDLEVPPPSLEACAMRAAHDILARFAPTPAAAEGHASRGPLRGQPMVRKALQLTQLLLDVGAAEGRSPWVGAAAVWSIILAAEFKDASSRAYSRQVAECLQHNTQAVQEHIKVYEQQLSSLLALLPYAPSQGADVGVEVARHAHTLLKLQSLSRMAEC